MTEPQEIAQADTIASDGAVDPVATLDEDLLRRRVKSAVFGAGDAVRVGRYELEHRLGQGGMGVVYVAVDRELERRIAIKLLLPGRAEGRERMVREARAMARLAHPNVVTVHEVGTHAGRVFVAMELIPGVTLRQWLATPHPRAAIIEMFLQAARGLSAAHDAGIVHRDFKPDNAIVGDDGRLRVLDFGLAKDTDEDDVVAAADGDDAVTPIDGALTRTGQLLGTPAYMSPEQILGGPVDARADVFAFCVSLFEALEGRRPFVGDNVLATHDSIQRGPPRATTTSPALADAIASGLAYEPAARPGLDRVIAALAAELAPAKANPWEWRDTVGTMLRIAIVLLAFIALGRIAEWFLGSP